MNINEPNQDKEKVRENAEDFRKRMEVSLGECMESNDRMADALNKLADAILSLSSELGKFLEKDQPKGCENISAEDLPF